MAYPSIGKTWDGIIPNNVLASGTCGECTWYIQADGVLQIWPTNKIFGKLDLESIDKRTRKVNGLVGWENREKATSVIINDGVSPGYSLSGFLVGCSHITSITFGNAWDTSRVNYMQNLFRGCTSLKEIDLSGFDTSKVKLMKHMFSECKSLEYLDLSSFDTSRVISMKAMFSNCENLKRVNVSSFNTSKVRNMNSMFRECYNLEQVDVSSFDVSSVQDMDLMFDRCNHLSFLDLSRWDTSNSESSDLLNNCAVQSVKIGPKTMSFPRKHKPLPNDKDFLWKNEFGFILSKKDLYNQISGTWAFMGDIDNMGKPTVWNPNKHPIEKKSTDSNLIKETPAFKIFKK